MYEVHETDAQSFIMKMVELVKATNIMHVNPRENIWQTILKESNNYLFEQIFNNGIEKFEYYEKSVGLVFDVLMQVGCEIFKYGNIFFYFYPTSRNCGSELGFCRRYYGEELRDHLKDKLQNTFLGPWGGKPFPLIFLIANCQKFCLALEKWIDIRGNSYVKTFMQVLKRKLSKLGTKNKEEPFHIPNLHYVKYCFE